MRRTLAAACVTLLAAPAAFAAPCITSQGEFPGYKQALSQQASAAGIGQQGLQALQSAQLSGITWRFESSPSSQSGVSYGDPATFLANRSGGSAQGFISQVSSRVSQNANLFSSLESSYGVPGSVLATIWGLETSFGGYLGQTPIVDGAVTLASYCRRHPRFEDAAIAALQLVDRPEKRSVQITGRAQLPRQQICNHLSVRFRRKHHSLFF